MNLDEPGYMRLTDTILATARERGMDEPWVAATKEMLRKKKKNTEFREALKVLIRGGKETSAQ
jgi:hypothetical protein